jgi:hypothetical protein
MPATSAPPKLRWYMIPVRVLLATLILALLSFAVSLFLGILGVVVAAGVHGVHPNMTIAYRYVAFPIAGTVAAVVLVSASFMKDGTITRQRRWAAWKTRCMARTEWR